MPAFELLTTKEISKLLNCKPNDVIHFFKAIGVQHIMCGQAYLWHKDEAIKTIQKFKQKSRKEAIQINQNL